MALSREKSREYFLHDTRVENIFINEYMTIAPGAFVKVYLFALMYADFGTDMSNEEIARNLNMQVEDVLKAWTYWENLGLIKKLNIKANNPFDYDIEFVRLKEQLYSSEAEPLQVDVPDSAMEDEDIRDMISDAEKLMGRTLSSSDLEKMLSWISVYSATPEIISYAFEYSVQRDKKNFNYVEAVIRGWTSEGFRTAMDVEKHLSEMDKKQHMYKRVFQALGFRRNATEEEKRIIDNWFGEMNFTLDKVLEACRKTTGISNPNINYVNKVLQNWHDEPEKQKQKAEGLSNSEIMRYYEALRTFEEAEAEKRRREVYSRIPRIHEIENEIQAQSANLSKIIISDRSDKRAESEKIRQKTEALNAERAILLTDNGFEMNYMEVQYECEKCKDTGILETGERCPCFGKITREKINQLKTKTTE